jgi:primosomal protein N' (replication factor Y)
LRFELKVIKVVLPVQVNSEFEYIADSLVVGGRVVVNFRNRNLIGLVVATDCETSLPKEKIKPIIESLDSQSIITPEYLDFLRWISRYYHEPLGMVVFTAMPSFFKKIDSELINTVKYYKIFAEPVKLTKKQQELYNFISKFPRGISYLSLLANGYRDKSISALLCRNIIQESETPVVEDSGSSNILPSVHKLNPEQEAAVNSIRSQDGFCGFLLEGVTGSGKTQVYLEVIAAVIASGKQALVLLPEIGLTPQTLQRFQKKFALPMAVLHSKLTDVERYAAWMLAYTGEAKLVIGTRSAIFAPLPDLGIIIVDEEHDCSFKQQSGLRYSARDLAVVRAKMNNIKVVLGTATPSLESLYNANQERYRHLKLLTRATGANFPTTKVVDMRSKKLKLGLAPEVHLAITRHLEAKNQILIFLNRRGFCPVIFCHSCGWSAKCNSCDINYTYHKDKNKLVCHSCTRQKTLKKVCDKCGNNELCEVGLGTEKLSQGLQELYPDTLITRIDRDAITASTAIDNLLESAYQGQSQIIVGTQMLAKGHHLPNITLVVVVDADGALYSSDFRAVEKLMQTLVQVSGRAGRESLAGEVLVQTHFPEHRFLQCVVNSSYDSFAKIALDERAQASMPPYGCLALLNAEAMTMTAANSFLQEVVAKNLAGNIPGVVLIGPMSAIQQKKSGKYRANLLIHASQKSILHRFLKILVEFLTKKRQTGTARWFLDVDPQEII